MSASRKRSISTFLLDPGYWQSRLTRMEEVQRGLVLIARPDLSSPLCDVVEWRLRAHDGTRIWGLRGTSPFHSATKGAAIREVASCDLPVVDTFQVAAGLVDFVFQVPAGRRLEDRVLDLVRVYQVALHGGLDPNDIRLVPSAEEGCPDEFLIAGGLLQRGLV